VENAPIKLEPLPLYVNPAPVITLSGLVVAYSLLHLYGFRPLRGREPQLAPSEIAKGNNEARTRIVPVDVGPPSITFIDLNGGEAEVRGSLLRSSY
jgi:hypothetical protein